METSKRELPDNTPVLTRIFYEDISQIATLDIKQRLYRGLTQRLADEKDATSETMDE